MATAQEIERLKRDWLDDPCYDLYGAEGFEEHEEELREFQTMTERRWEAERAEREAKEAARWASRVAKKAEELGIPDNLRLAEYVLKLEARVDAIDKALCDAQCEIRDLDGGQILR